MSERVAACRICAGQCSLRFAVDDAGRIVQARGDKANPVTRGYACIKGLTAHQAHYSPDRILHPLKRQPDGGFATIALDAALDEIAARLQAIVARDGPDSVAGFRGTMSYTNALANQMLPDWLRAIGSRSFFSTMTIDQSAKWVTAGRLGAWAAGKDPFDQADVLLFLGTNPLVSLSTFNFNLQNPVKAMRDARARGLKVVVIDPRRSETAQHADVFVQPLPGEDPTLLAGMLRMILAEGWHDAAFCADHVAGLEELRAAIEPFDPAHVETRAGVPQATFLAAVEAFAAPFDGRRRRGSAASGTGPNMAAHSNLAEHLLECLNIVCGRYAKPGDRVMNPGVLGRRWPRYAQVVPPHRSWETGWRDAGGYGLLFGERMSGALPDAILGGGEGKIRALIVDGGNPANAIAQSDYAERALAALDLLVAIEPFMTETAKLADYVLPPLMMFERPDIPNRDYEAHTLMAPYAQYSEAVIGPPVGSELIEDWRVFWELARRMGHVICFDGVPIDMETPPTSRELIALLLRHSAAPVDEILGAHEGRLFDVEPMFVEPGRGEGRFEVAPAEVVAEIAEVRAEKPLDNSSFRFAVRRVRDTQNSMYHALPEIAARMSENPLWVHPDDMAAHNLSEGERIRLVSAHGAVEATVAADATIRSGVVAMNHGWGHGRGVNVNRLTSLRHGRDPINAMPTLTGFAVWIERLDQGGNRESNKDG